MSTLKEVYEAVLEVKNTVSRIDERQQSIIDRVGKVEVRQDKIELNVTETRLNLKHALGYSGGILATATILLALTKLFS